MRPTVCDYDPQRDKNQDWSKPGLAGRCRVACIEYLPDLLGQRGRGDAPEGGVIVEPFAVFGPKGK